MLGKIIMNKDIPFQDPNTKNLVNEVSIKTPVTYKNGELTILVIDCGIKNSIITKLLARGITLIRVPYDYDFNIKIKIY